MNILFAAPENAWGGFLNIIRRKLPQHHFEATGGFDINTLHGFDVLIPTMSRVHEDILATANRLRLIQQCGSGLEGVDLDAAIKRNIWVANVPTEMSGNADSVAELGIYMMIGLSRDVYGMRNSLRTRKMGEPQGRSLKGKTVGLIGLGGIAKALIKRLKAFDVKLIGIKRSNIRDSQAELGLDWVGASTDIDQLLSQADYVVLCLPASHENMHIINQTSLARMKKDAFLINLSRGGLIDRDALENALASNLIAGAGLDVFWEEPPDPNDRIFNYNVLATPHIAGITDVAMQGISNAVAENISRLENNLKPFYTKNA